MPEEKVYKFKNKKTGETIAIKWNGANPPTSEDIKNIKIQRDAESVKQLPQVNLPTKIGAGIADALWAPSEFVAPKSLSQEETRKLPIASRVKRIGQSVASGVLDPEALAVMATAPLPGADLAIPAYFAGKMISHEPELIREHLKDPSLESGTNLALNTLGIAGGLYGAKVGAQNAIPKLRPGTVTDIGGVPSGPTQTYIPPEGPTVNAPKGSKGYSNTNVTGQKSIESDLPIETDYTIKGDKLPPASDQSIVRGNQLPARTEKPIRGEGFTVNAPRIMKDRNLGVEEIDNRPLDVESISDKLKYGPNDRLITEQTGFQTNPASQLKVELPDDIIKQEEPVIDQPKVEFVKPVKIEKAKPQRTAAMEEVDKEATDGIQVKFNEGQKIARDQRIEDIKRERGITNEVKEETPIENEWLRQQSIEALNAIRKGAKGQLLNEVDTVLGERGSPTTKSQIKVELPKTDLKEKLKAANEASKSGENLEQLDDEYMTQLARHQINSRTQLPKKSELSKTIQLGRKLGKSNEEITQDLIDSNIPERQIKRVMLERGSFTFGSPKPKAFRLKEAIKKGETPSYEEVKNDTNDLGRTLSAWLDPLPRAIKKFGGDTHAADELARLIQVERTERNRLNGVYSNEVIKGGVSSDRSFGPQNITDEDFGNYRVRNNTTGKVEVIVPQGSSGANEGAFVHYADGKIEANEGFTLIKPKAGNLIDVLTDNALPANDQIALAARKVRQVLDELGKRGESSGVGMRIGESGTVPFQRMTEGYFPRKYTSEFFDSLIEDPTANENVLKNIMDKAKAQGKPLTRGEAQAYIRNSRKQGEILSAPQHARLANYDAFIRDRSALFNHIQELSHRIGTAETLGPKDVNGPMISQMLEEIQKAGGDEKLVRSYINRVVGRDEAGLFRSNENKVYRAMSSILTAKYLPFFAISDMATLGNIAMRGSIDRVIPAIWRNLTVQDRMKNNIMSTGALSEHLTNDLAPESFFGKLYKVREAESFLRGVAADVGRSTSQDLLNYVKSKSSDPKSFSYKTAYGRLKNLLLKNDEQMAKLLERGELTNKERDFAGGRMAEMTQGLVDPVDMPYQWSNKNGGLMMDFVFTYKRFAYQSSKLLIESIKENPTKTIPLLMTMAPAIGEILGDTKAAIKGAISSVFSDEGLGEAIIREIEDRGKFQTNFSKAHPLISRYLDDLGQSWALGLVSDFLGALSEGGSKLSEFITGPAIGMIGEIAGHVAAIKNDLFREPSIDWDKVEKDFVKFGTSQLPGSIGNAVERSEKGSTSNKGNPNSLRVERPQPVRR